MTIRIPIRKWEKVTTNRWGFPTQATGRFEAYDLDDRYCLQVVINGEILECNVTYPKYLGDKDPEGLRRHVVESLSRQIAGIVGDEIRRTLV